MTTTLSASQVREWHLRIYRALHHFQQGEAEHVYQESIFGNQRQHLLQHPVGTTVHQ